MKKIICIIALVLFVLPQTALASSGNLESTSVRSLPENQTIEADYFSFGEIVELSGTVKNDAYLAGGQVSVDGTVDGDLLVAGGTVTVTGSINGNLRVMAGQVLITGKIKGNTTVLGGSVEATENAVFEGNLVLGSGSVVINAPVSGDINVAAGSIRLGSKADIKGNINYVSEDDLTLSDTATVSGMIKKTEAPNYNPPSKKDVDNLFSGIGTFFSLTSIVTTLIIGLFMIRFLPNYTKKAADTINQKFLSSFALGILALLIIPVVIIILMVTLIGFPLALLLGMVFLFYLYIVRIFAMVAIGTKLASWIKLKTSSYWIFVIGLAGYYILSMIPILGFFIKMFIFIASFGAALVNERETWRQASKAKVI